MPNPNWATATKEITYGQVTKSLSPLRRRGAKGSLFICAMAQVGQNRKERKKKKTKTIKYCHMPARWGLQQTTLLQAATRHSPGIF